MECTHSLTCDRNGSLDEILRTNEDLSMVIAARVLQQTFVQGTQQTLKNMSKISNQNTEKLYQNSKIQ